MDFGDGDVRDFKLDRINYVDSKLNVDIMTHDYKINLMDCVPRPERLTYQKPQFKRVRTPWTIPISIFKDYKYDTEVNFHI